MPDYQVGDSFPVDEGHSDPLRILPEELVSPQSTPASEEETLSYSSLLLLFAIFAAIYLCADFVTRWAQHNANHPTPRWIDDQER